MRLLVKVIPVFVVMAVATPSFAIETVVVTASRIYDDGRGGKVGHNFRAYSFPHGHEINRAVGHTERRNRAQVLAAIIVAGIDISKGANAAALVNDALTELALAAKNPLLTFAQKSALYNAYEALVPYREVIVKTPTVLANIAVRLGQAQSALQLAALRASVTYGFGAGMGSFVGRAVVLFTADTLAASAIAVGAAGIGGYIVGSMIYNYSPLVQMGAINTVEYLDNIRRRIVGAGGGRRGGAHR